MKDVVASKGAIAVGAMGQAVVRVFLQQKLRVPNCRRYATL